jgi:hypothetical protein
MNQITHIDSLIPKQLLLGFIGAAGSGKDTCADLLQAHGFHRIAFADALRLEVSGAFGIDVRELTERDTKEQTDSALALNRCKDQGFTDWMFAIGHNILQDRSPRWVMQQWGTQYRRAQMPNYWLNKVRSWVNNMRATGHHRLCITDVRFQNEIDLLRSLSGYFLPVIRPNASGTLQAQTQRHESEALFATRASYFEIYEPHIIHNDGDLDHLQNELLRVITSLHPNASSTQAAE